MPSSAIYQQAAVKFEAASDETINLNDPVEEAAADTTAVSGHLGTLVQGVITDARLQTTTISGQFSELGVLAHSKSTSETDTIVST